MGSYSHSENAVKKDTVYDARVKAQKFEKHDINQEAGIWKYLK